MRLGITALLFLIFMGKAQAQTPAAAPAAGLAIGQQAPQFEGADQFGHTVTNQTLRGSRGTIVLFFRSADW